MSIEATLQAGIAAAKAGDLERAAAFFAQVVKADPNSEQGWYWLGQCCSTPEQREYCFKRVLSINPGNVDARQRLEWMSTPAPAAAAPKPPPLPAQPTGTQTPPPPASSTVSPFIFDATESKPEPKPPIPAAPRAGVYPATPVEKPVAVFQAEASGSEGPGQHIPQRKQGNKAVSLILPFLLVVAIGCLAVGFLYSTGRLDKFIPGSQVPAATLPAGLDQTATPTSTLQLPTPSSPPPTPTPAALATMKPTVVYAPNKEKTTCPFDSPHGFVVDCYYVSVPEDRTDAKSEKIQLAVAVYHSKNKNPAEPVMFLQGGPGAEAVQLAADAVYVLVEPFLSDRDFIVYDQRGTGLSKPALGCQELTKAFLQDIHGQIPGSSRNLVYSSAFLSCRGAMRVVGVNLNAYTTEASAADIKDILSVLGYKKVDLYGASYGTRLAQVVMREYPDILQSVIVDSVVPTETKIFNTDPEGYYSAIQSLFKVCKDDPKCNASFPNLENDFWQTVDELDASPVSVTGPSATGGTITEEVDGSTLLSAVLGLLKSSFVSPVPQTISQVKNGDFTTMIDIQASLPYEFEGISPGLYISMMCHEHLLATTPDELKSDLSKYHNIWQFSQAPFFGTADDLFKTCKSWGATPPAAGENDPVFSDIPTLVIAGKFDPATPPAWSKLLASHLSHSYFYEFPTSGHCPTASSSCAMDMAVAFLKDPNHAPDSSCMNNIPPIEFATTYTGKPPLELKTVQEMGLSVDVPADWYEYRTGVYRRYNSVFDITQISVLKIPSATSQEVVDSLSSMLYNYGGFDAAPAASGKEEANGLDWSLYTTSSYGRPVDLAMADVDNGKETLVVILFCHKDEHDAFYQTVFMPIINSILLNE